VKLARARIDGANYVGQIHDDHWFRPIAHEGDAQRDVNLAEVDLRTVDLLPPAQPSKIIVGLGAFPSKSVISQSGTMSTGQSRDAARLRRPKLGSKLPSAVVGPGRPIILPVDAPGPALIECELAVVIGRPCRRVPVADAFSMVLGLTCVNDVTILAYSNDDHDYSRGKSIDTFCPIGPWIETGLTDDDVASGLKMSSAINGSARQVSSTSEYTFRVSEMVSEISHYFTLYPGDVISLGSPPGAPSVSPGDVAEISIEGIGSLRNPVLSAAQAGTDYAHASAPSPSPGITAMLACLADTPQQHISAQASTR
jgi:2-keto-4-pentenoate hydratase/2-oxohepta-3-ene-1,7-dioic acid hydratase in catechol pathway